MTEVRPFIARASEEAVADLRRRLETTRWFDDAFEGDWRFGAPLPFVKSLCDHWLNRFDWRAVEARINRQPNVTTVIDGMTIHAVHRRSTRKDAVPLMMLHGWPSSFLEFLDLCDPLAEPPAGAPAFHVICASLPGYGYSTVKPGMTPQRCASVLAALMERLGYDRYMLQGGDWGGLISTEIARQFPERVSGLHLNLVNGSPPPDRDSIPLTPQEQSWVADHDHWRFYPYFVLQSQLPASLAHALNDSPAGLAAWIGEKIHDWVEVPVSLDQIVETVALYWFTGSIASSMRLYYEMVHDFAKERYVEAPTAGAIFPKEIAKLPRAWAERHYNIVHWSVFDRGGHFPAMETPDVLIQDLRSFAAQLSGC